MDDSNPYQASTVGEAATVAPPRSRSVSPMVFGILCIVFAGLSLLFLPFSLWIVFSDPGMYEQMGYSAAYARGSTILGLPFAVWLLVTGIGLVRYRKWGRVSFNVYAVITILWGIGNSIYMFVNLFGSEFANPAQQAGAIGGSIGGMFGLIFPILGLAFLNLASVRASLR